MSRLLISLKTDLSIALNTEERELLEMETSRKDLKAQRERNDKSLIRSKEFQPIQLRQKSTVPKPFNLLTNKIRQRVLLTSEERIIQEMKNRPKFKARANPHPNIHSKQMKDSSSDTLFKAKPMPDFSLPFKPKLGQRRPCKPIKVRLHTMQRAEVRDSSTVCTLDSINKTSFN